MREHDEYVAARSPGWRSLAALITLCAIWWLTTGQALAAGDASASTTTSRWTMWLVVGPMLLAAAYVWRSVLRDLIAAPPTSAWERRAPALQTPRPANPAPREAPPEPAPSSVPSTNAASAEAAPTTEDEDATATTRPHTHRIGDAAVSEDVALHAAASLLAASKHGAVVFSTSASDEANALVDRIATLVHAARYVASTGPNNATAERLAAAGEPGGRAMHEMELALALAGRGIDCVLFVDERADLADLTLRSLADMDSICLADAVSPTSTACRVLLHIDGEAARLRMVRALLELLDASGSETVARPDPAPA